MGRCFCQETSQSVTLVLQLAPLVITTDALVHVAGAAKGSLGSKKEVPTHNSLGFCEMQFVLCSHNSST